MRKIFRVERHGRHVGVSPEPAHFIEYLPGDFETYKQARSFIFQHIASYPYHGFNEERGYWWGRAPDADLAHIYTVRFPD